MINDGWQRVTNEKLYPSWMKIHFDIVTDRIKNENKSKWINFKSQVFPRSTYFLFLFYEARESLERVYDFRCLKFGNLIPDLLHLTKQYKNSARHLLMFIIHSIYIDTAAEKTACIKFRFNFKRLKMKKERRASETRSMKTHWILNACFSVFCTLNWVFRVRERARERVSNCTLNGCAFK